MTILKTSILVIQIFSIILDDTVDVLQECINFPKTALQDMAATAKRLHQPI